ncbi:HAD family hydrolase [Desulfocicer vacuolatum]|nr:HAD family hydrolase [Desulfocicer vacuolatum]
MFVTDLDGTLFTDEKIIHEKDLAALTALGSKGVTRVFATGRSLYSFQKAIREMGFSPTCNDMPVDYVIFSTGAGTMECTHGEIIKKESLSAKDVSVISDCFDSLGLDYMIHRPVPDTRHFVYKKGNFSKNDHSGGNGETSLDGICNHGNAYGNSNSPARGNSLCCPFHDGETDNPDFYSRISLYRNFCRPMEKIEKTDFGESTEVLAIVPPARGHDMADRVYKALGDFSVIKATSPLDGKSIWIEVFNPLVSKSQVVAWLAAKLGVNRKDVVAVGNDYNDLDLLQWSGQGFVVANAPTEVKQGFKVVASNNECGVSRVVLNHMGCSLQLA